MKKGGKPKDGLAVMIAIGSPMKGMKKPVKKALGGGMDAKLSRGITNVKANMDRMAAAPGFDPSKPSSGSSSFAKMLGLTDKTVAKPARMGAPVKKAQGGAGKVRKGMMTPEGKIVDAMNKVRGK